MVTRGEYMLAVQTCLVQLMLIITDMLSPELSRIFTFDSDRSTVYEQLEDTNSETDSLLSIFVLEGVHDLNEVASGRDIGSCIKHR